MAYSQQEREKYIDELIDRQRIVDVLYKFTRSTDRLDWEVLKTCFFDDAIIDYGQFKMDNSAGFIEYSKTRLGSKGKDNVEYETCSHPIFNIYVRFSSEDVALSEAYVSTVSRRWVKGKLLNAVGYGRYLDRFERRQGEWRIAKRRFVIDQFIELPSDITDNYWTGPDVNRGQFGRSDPLYEFLGS